MAKTIFFMNNLGDLQIWGPRTNARNVHAVIRPWLLVDRKLLIDFSEGNTKFYKVKIYLITLSEKLLISVSYGKL